MTKWQIRKGKFPDRLDFEKYYVEQKLPILEIAKIYGAGRQRVQKWAIEFGIELRSHHNRMGDGNNRKFHYDPIYLQQLVDDGYSNAGIAKLLGVKKRSVTHILSTNKIYRDYDINEYQRYCRKVKRLTNGAYNKYRDLLNPHNLPRTLCGVEGGYQVDHIKEVYECFRDGISAEECANIKNLQFIPWQENLTKRKWYRGVSHDPR